MCKLIAVMFAVSLTFNSATAQSLGSLVAPKDTQAVAIAQRAIAAMGGNQLISGQTSEITGTLALVGSNPVTFPLTIKSRGSNQLRSELTTSKGVRITVFSGGHGAIRRPDGSIRHLSDGNAVAQRNMHIPALSLLSEYQNSNIALSYVGTVAIDGTTTDVVAVGIYSGIDAASAQQLSQKTHTQFLVDRATGYVLRVQQVNHAENDPNSGQTLETRFSDYREINSVAVPFRQETYADGQLAYTFVVNSVNFGVAVSDEEFTVGQ